MAAIRMVSWNIQVFGPTKYGTSVNNDKVIWIVANLVQQQNANVLVLMELMTSVSYQICFNVCEAIQMVTGNPWTFKAISARPQGDREAYGIFWQTNANFTLTNNATGAPNLNLSSLQFPNNFSASHGRRAAIANFKTTDTNTNFAVSVYHAPPNNNAVLGFEALAKSPEIYFVNNAGTVENVPHRLLGGDYNQDINTVADYEWLTDPVPAPPPPTVLGQGAGSQPVTHARTDLMTLNQGIATWGPFPGGWSPNSNDYLHLQLDNIFVSSAIGPGSGMIDVMQLIMNPFNPLRVIAQTFFLADAFGNPAFPNAGLLPPPLNVNLNHACCAWLLYRYAISDHYPLIASTNI